MANTDNSNTGLTDLNPNHGGDELVCALNTREEASTVSTDQPAAPSDTPCISSPPHLISPTNPSLPPRPSIAPTNSSSPFLAPHPKKFSAVNINKKFLEKNSSSSGSATASLNHVPVAKSGSPAPVRPVPVPTSTHSRLVTAKLTAVPVSSTTTGPGWSRPSSATPSTPSTSSNASPPQHPPSATVSAPVSVPAAPQLPVVGKVIQPQPRAMVSTSSFSAKKESASKPAWGNPKVAAPVPFPESAGPSDFPTAAEVAQGRPSPKLLESSKPLDVPSSKTVTLEEADAFRGVHLDPNTHHWDEMEEDDDHFLDGVIEFGDGRQYKISPAEASVQNAPSPGPTTDTLESSEPHPEAVDDSRTHVTKEDRFADDYDRRWPRSKPSPSVTYSDLHRPTRHPSISPTSSHPSYSPSEGSKVLFNERSNKLEPYSSHPHTRHLPGGPMSGRNSHAEQGIPPMDARIGRDGPSRSPVQPVQLLQKPLGSYDRSSRPLRGVPTPHVSFGRIRDRDGLHSSLNRNTGLPSDEKRDFGPDGKGRRLSNMGPPPLPSSLKRDLARQLPPHISTGPTGRLFSRDPHPPQPPPQPSFGSPTSTAQSPLLSAVSVTSEIPAPLSTPALTLEDVHKTTMHISAERAKQRRQVEEEEREKEKERARQKAAALEEKFKVNEEKKMAQDAEVVQFIQDSVETANSPSQSTPQLLDTAAQRAMSVRQTGRPPSLRPSARPPLVPRSTALISNTEQSQDSSRVDSWRSKAPRPSSPAPQESSVETRVPPPLLHGVEEFPISADEDLEVVDFSDLGKLVGVPMTSPSKAQHDGISRLSHPPRPVASDFFDDSQHQPLPPRPKSPNAWRRKASIQLIHDVLAPPTSTNQEETRGKVPQDPLAHPASPKSFHEKVAHIPASAEDDSTAPSFNQATLPVFPHRLNRPSMSYREAPMSALDDVISRIKGALDNMQATESARIETAKQANKETGDDVSHAVEITKSHSNADSRVHSGVPKWLPPALRPRRIDFDREDQEVFDVTGCEPPRSPIVARNAFVVRLPTQSRPVDPLPKWQLHNVNAARWNVRWDILSWDPPVEGMSRRDFSLNDVLFKGHTSFRSNPRYRVLLPQTRHKYLSSAAVPLGPKVNLPSGSSKSSSSYGRSKVDDLPSWRRVTVASSIPETSPDAIDAGALDTISCSPPPTPEAIIDHSVSPSVSKAEITVQRPRVQPKMPQGTAVAFYREPPTETVRKVSKNIVTFTVVSELDVLPSTLQSDPPSVLFSSAVESPDTASPIKDASEQGCRVGKDTNSPRLVVSTQLDSKNADESADRSLITPGSTSYGTPWTKSPLSFASAKESPARAPDPEHLKAVWSQPPDKAPVPAVNSLEGIADDLTALPFTLQDVKSEDGETPPPTSASNAPSKMSLHDVTRAFQQVPASSNTATRGASALPSSSASGPISRPSSYTYGPVHPPNMGVRPPYPYSPMMAHSPSPTLVYPPAAPSPSPRMPVNGHSPMFGGGQPIWVPLQPSQNHTGAVRAVPSPYPTQLMAYPSPNGGPSMYGPPPLSHGAQSPQANGAAQSRPRNNMPMMSPVMHSASPSHTNHSMYAGSPVMMHALPMIAQPYMTVPAGRGQGRPDGMPVMQQSHPNSQPSHPPLYSPAQPLSQYARPSW